MNSRERFLSIFLIVIIALGAGGFCGYQFIYSPLKRNHETVGKLREDVDKLEADLKVSEYNQFVYETKTKKKSLPLDVNTAQREYEQLLNRMLRKAQFQAQDTKIQPKPPDNKSNVPMVANKKPAYTKLDFDVNVKGDLLSLTEFMHNFYRQKLLHQIYYINVIKPTARANAREGQELDIQLKIEALVLDQAENRGTLLSPEPVVGLTTGGAAAVAINARAVETGVGSPFTSVGVLARSDDTLSKVSAQDEYRRIAGKDIFFGPAPSIKQERPVREKEIDLSPFLELTRVSHSDGKSLALVFDRYNKEDYEIDEDSEGKITVTQFWYSNREENGNVVEIRHRKATTNAILTFGSEEKGNLHSFSVRRITEHGLLLEPYDANRLKLMKGAAPLILGGSAYLALPGNLSVWNVGQMLKSQETGKILRPLTKLADARAELIRPLNLTNEASDDEKPEKTTEKPKFSRKR